MFEALSEVDEKGWDVMIGPHKFQPTPHFPYRCNVCSCERGLSPELCEQMKVGMKMPRTYKKPMFSKRHYEEIASLLHDELVNRTDTTPQLYSYKVIESIMERFITAFMHDNPRFDQEKFRKAVEG